MARTLTSEQRRKRELMQRNRNKRELSRAGRNIGPIPDIVNARRRKSCKSDFGKFCKEYFKATFYLPFSNDHLKVIDKVERAVLGGELFSVAMPRGSGKTMLCESAAIFSLLYGHNPFVLVIGASSDMALLSLDSIKTELESNEKLLEDFPETCFPIYCLEGEPKRCRGQMYTPKALEGVLEEDEGDDGVKTHIQWMSDRVVLPTIENSAASGGVLRTTGVTASFRGMKHKLRDGRVIRPSLVLLDDPQTDDSAMSVSQCATRERVIAGAVLGLAGPGKKIAGIMPCTVIRKDDMADRALDVDLHPEWNGSRFKLLYKLPTNLQLWESDYRAIMVDFDPDVPGDKSKASLAATEYYRQHRAEMDLGAEAAWEARRLEDELSAIQHAMNLYLRNKRAFFAEYQNEPMPEVLPGSEALTAAEILDKLNGLAREVVPLNTVRVTGSIDVQGDLLYYSVAAWADDFTGSLIDYGAFPGQSRSYFTLREAAPTLKDVTGKTSVEAAIYAGLTMLSGQLLGREWRREDGTVLHLEKVLVDVGWGQMQDLVYQFCRETVYKGIIQPSHGRGIGASKRPITARKKDPREKLGLNWYIPASSRQAIRPLWFDTNFWKSFVLSRLRVAKGGSGSLTIFGSDPRDHKMLADHLTAEFPVRTKTDERTVDEWNDLPHRDNHWWDTLVGSAVAASVMGSILPDYGAPKLGGSGGKKLSYAEMYKQARGGG